MQTVWKISRRWACDLNGARRVGAAFENVADLLGGLKQRAATTADWLAEACPTSGIRRYQGFASATGSKTTGLSAGWQAEACPTSGVRRYQGFASATGSKNHRPVGRLAS